MFAKVIVGMNRPETDRLFDYIIPEGMTVETGCRVIVPFGRRNAKTEGYVLSLSETTEVPAERLKALLEVLDDGRPVFTPVLLALAKWMKERYFCTLNQCLQAVMPPGIRTKSEWMLKRREQPETGELTPLEQTLFSLLPEGESISLSRLEEEMGRPLTELARSLQEKGAAELKQVLHRSEYKKERKYLSLNKSHPLFEETKKKAERESRLEGQRKIFAFLADGREVQADALKTALHLTDSPIRTLLKKGILTERTEEARRNVFDLEDFKRTKPFTPTAEQKTALDAMKAELEKEEKRPILLHGITGSGKTEIYMQIIAEVLAKGKQAVVLVPEIALTPLISERFISRFGEAVSVTHSRLSMGERLDQWKKARDGEISVIIGPRSALFMPFRDIGIIIMDEAHENSYLSDTTPKYDTKEAAAEAARLTGALFIMGTATPDMVSYYKARQGEYLLLELKERTGGGSLPEVFVTDMRKELEEGNFSPFGRALQKAVRETLDRGEQAMLFLNRRGYSTFVSCRKCGFVMECPACDVPYTYHAGENILLCHYCGRKVPVPKVCPACGSKYIRYFGTGTEKIEEEARKTFPDARILRMDVDTTTTKNSHERILKAFGNGEADILIGTQLIAKGHDFPNVSLVGILAADTTLNLDSFRAAETGFRLMTQAAGRAGRTDSRGRAFIQTYQPAHYAVRHAAEHDFKGFYEEEIILREMMGYPPFASFFRILLVGEDGEAADREAARLAEELKKGDTEGEFFLLGPAQLRKFRGEERRQLIIKGENREKLTAFVLPAVEKAKRRRNQKVRFQLTLDPEDLT